MPWQPKTTAPASFNLGEAFAALITGDSTWGWLLAWVPIIENVDIDTALFCAQGPSPAGGFDPTVFVPTRSRNWLEQIVTTIGRAAYVKAIAYDRVFSAYCEFPVAAGPSCTYMGAWGWTSNGGLVYLTENLAIPPSDYLHIHMLDSSGGQPVLRIYTYDASNALIGNNYFGLYGGQSLDFGAGMNQTVTHISIQVNEADCASAHFTVEACLTNAPAHMDDHPLADPVEPPGALAPRVRTYENIADLGAELDDQELKLDYILSIVQYLARETAVPPSVPVEDPVDVAEDSPIDITDAAGIIINIAGIPPGADEDFGVPVRLHRVGRVTLGNEQGWLPSFDLEHNPLLIMPIPRGVTRVQVSTHPPVSATVLILPKSK